MRILTVATMALALCGLGAAQSAELKTIETKAGELKTATATRSDAPWAVSRVTVDRQPDFLQQYKLVKVRQQDCSPEAIEARTNECLRTCTFSYHCHIVCPILAAEGC
jgi:hypothetical protein